MTGELATVGKKVLANSGQPNWLSRVGERVDRKKKGARKEEKAGHVCSPLSTSTSIPQLTDHRCSLSASAPPAFSP